MKKYRVVEIENGITFIWYSYNNKKELSKAVESCFREHERYELIHTFEHNEEYSYEVQVQKYNKKTNTWEEFTNY